MKMIALGLVVSALGAIIPVQGMMKLVEAKAEIGKALVCYEDGSCSEN